MSKMLILVFLLLNVRNCVAESQMIQCSPDHCKKDNYSDRTWFETPVNDGGLSEEICVTDNGWERRPCRVHSEKGACWSMKKYQCLSDYPAKNITLSLYNMLKDLRIYRKYDSLDITYLRNLSESAHDLPFHNIQLLVNCLYYLPNILSTREIEDVVYIINNVMKKGYISMVAYEEVYLKLYNALENFIKILKSNRTNITVKASNLFVYAWHPFKNNISGVALYTDSQTIFSNVDYLSLFQLPELSELPPNITLETLETAAYVSRGFLQSLVNDSGKYKEDLYIVMVVAKKAEMIKDYFKSLYQKYGSKDFVAISIPGYCKKSYDIMLTVVHTNHVLDYGEEYFDFFDKEPEKCMLSNLSYFGVKNSSYKGTFESPKRKYCIESNLLTPSIEWAQVQAGSISFKRQFCATEDLDIVIQYCDNSTDKNAILKNTFNLTLDCFNHSISEITQYWYESVIKCGNDFDDKVFSIARYNLTRADAKLYFYLLTCLINSRTVDVEYLNKLIVEGFEISETVSDIRRNRIVYIMQFFQYFLNVLPTNSIYDNSDFTYVNFKPFNVVGVAVYEKSTEFLNLTDIKSRYIVPDNMEVAIYLSYDTLENLKTINSSEEFAVTLAVIKRKKFVEDEKYFSKSRILAISYNSEQVKFPIEFIIYAKFVDNERRWKFYDDQGIWFSILVQNGRLEMVFVQSHYFKCKWNTEPISFYLSKPTTNYIYDSVLFPMVLQNKSLNFNKMSSQIIYENSKTPLEIVTFIANILSVIGIAFIIFTAVIFEPWRKVRFCSIQFSTALACQTIFFFRDNSTLTESEYVLFYYWTLAQYSWLLIMCFNKYIRYLVIFPFTNLRVWKSILVGWLLPVVIALIPTLLYPECLSCSLCFENSSIFILFIAIPLLPMIVSLILIYVVVMIKIKKEICEKYGVSVIKIRLRASLLLIFLLIVTVILFMMVMLPWSIVKLLGVYYFYIVTPLHGFTLFIVIIILDEQIRNTLIFYIRSKFGREDN